MNELTRPSAGACSGYLEYRRSIHRRLFTNSGFNDNDVLEIGKKLESEKNINCYKSVKTKRGKFYVQIGKYHEISLPVNKKGKRVFTNSLDDLPEIKSD
tara:strand:- start:195 stop:491 length:297 start_codon:yes stop_codon:yes gene_type:complete